VTTLEGMGRAAAGVGKRGRLDAGDRGNTDGQTDAGNETGCLHSVTIDLDLRNEAPERLYLSVFRGRRF
jgi:hypothetical protein